MKLWEFASLFAAMACVNLASFHKNTKIKWEILTRPKRNLMRLFFLELIRFLLYSYCTNDQIEQTCEDLPREYFSCFYNTENFARRSTTKNCFREFRYQMNESSIDLFNWIQRFQCVCKLTIAKMHNLTRAKMHNLTRAHASRI